MEKVVHVVMWIFVGAIVVLIVKNASGFATAVNAVGGQVTNNASLLAGNNVSPIGAQNTGKSSNLKAA